MIHFGLIRYILLEREFPILTILTSLFPVEYKSYLSKYDDATYSKMQKLWIRTPFYIPDGQSIV